VGAITACQDKGSELNVSERLVYMKQTLWGNSLPFKVYHIPNALSPRFICEVVHLGYHLIAVMVAFGIAVGICEGVLMGPI
jgi:hypothetical protein